MAHIVIIGPAHPLRGGIATFNERLAREYQSQGHRVRIVTFSLQYPNFLFPGKTQLSSEKKPDDLDIYVCINSVNPISWWQVGSMIGHWQADIVVCRFWLPFMSPALGTILRIVKWKSPRTEIVGLIDNIVPHEKRLGDRPLAQYFVNTVERFVVMSQSVAEEMRTFTTTKKVAYSPHPLFDNYGESVPKNEACGYLKIDSQEKYILFFGLIREYKGLDWLLSAFAKANLEGIKLLIAGEFYGSEKPYMALIEELGIKDKIILHPHFVADEDVKYYFGAADLVVQPYKSATQSGISQVAYHFEKPMVVTNVGGLAEIVPNGKAGYVVAPEVDTISEAISNFFVQKPNFSVSIKEEKKRFSWETFTRVLYSDKG